MGKTGLTLLTSLHTAQSCFLRDCTTRIDDQQTHRRFSLRIRRADGLHIIVWNCCQTAASPATSRMPQIHWHELERRKKTGASTTVKVQFLVQFFQKMAAYAAIVAAFMVVCPGGRGQSPSYYRDVAFEREAGTQVEYSSFLFRSKKSEEQIPCPVNHGANAADALGPCHWRSNEFQHLPQWVWVHFAGPRRIDKVVLHAASAATMPVEFSGQYRERGATFHTIIHVQDAHFDPQTLTYTIQFMPVVTDNFRLLIERNTAKETPLSWRAELAQMEVFGTDAAERGTAAATEASAAEGASVPHPFQRPPSAPTRPSTTVAFP